jgi:hypothetical protein
MAPEHPAHEEDLQEPTPPAPAQIAARSEDHGQHWEYEGAESNPELEATELRRRSTARDSLSLRAQEEQEDHTPGHHGHLDLRGWRKRVVDPPKSRFGNFWRSHIAPIVPHEAARDHFGTSFFLVLHTIPRIQLINPVFRST